MPILDGTTAKIRSIGVKLTTTNQTTIYTCPSNYTGVIKLIHVGNIAGSNADITLEWTDSSASATYKITNTTTVNTKLYLQLSEGFFIFNAGDTLKATASSADALDVIVSVEELFTPGVT